MKTTSEWIRDLLENFTTYALGRSEDELHEMLRLLEATESREGSLTKGVLRALLKNKQR